MICLYHRTDFDGKCSGAIVKYMNPECRMYGIDHADKFDLEKIEANEEVVMVDFSFKKIDEMKSLIERCGTFTWIDHHITCRQIEQQIREQGLFDPLGIRAISNDPDDPDGVKNRSKRVSGCELTWKFFCYDRKIPYPVWLLGRYDIWDDQNLLWEKEILPFQYGMRLQHGLPEDQEFWKPYFEEDNDVIERTLIDGKAALTYDKNLSERMAKGLWFPIEFKGFKFQVINRSHGNLLSAKSIWNPEEFDGIMYYCKGPHTWRITMFTDKPGVDFYPLSKSLGGGGHDQACGFTTRHIMDIIPQLIEF